MAALRFEFESCDSAVVTESLSLFPAGIASRCDPSLSSSCATRRLFPRFPTVSFAGIAGENNDFAIRFSTGIRVENDETPAVLASRDQTTS